VWAREEINHRPRIINTNRGISCNGHFKREKCSHLNSISMDFQGKLKSQCPQINDTLKTEHQFTKKLRKAGHVALRGYEKCI
jgi:putative heme iron utilization protein